MDDTPTSKQFRIGELKAIIADADALLERIAVHNHYLSDPTLQEAHRADCRDNDVVLTNLALAAAQITSAKGQFAIALKLTNTPDPIQHAPAVEPEQPTEETTQP